MNWQNDNANLLMLLFRRLRPLRDDSLTSGIGKWLSWLCGLLAVLLLAGCSVLPKAQPDPTRFYVLSTPAAAAPAAAAGGATLALKPIEVAAYLSSPAMVVRRGGNEIELRDFARWGEPLERGIARVLREELLARGGVAAVVPGSARSTASNPKHDVELSVRVLTCEGAADGEVLFRAVWLLANPSEKSAAIARGDYRAANLRWDGKNEAQLAAGLSEAVAGLAAEIAAALNK